MAQNALGTLQGSFCSHGDVIKAIEEHKKESTLVNSFIMKPKTTGKGRAYLTGKVPLKAEPEGPRSRVKLNPYGQAQRSQGACGSL